MLKVKITGFRELNRKLKQLPIKIEQKVLGRAALAGAAVVRKDARRRAPKKTGLLRKSIVSRKKRGKYFGEVLYQIGPTVSAFYGQFIESGFVATGPKKRGLTFRESRGRAKLRNKHYPAKPFLRPAFDENTKKIIDAMKIRLQKGIETEAAKLGRL